MTRKHTDTRERIIRAAAGLYSIHGCAGTTLEDILTTSGVTKGGFYHYFKSKDDLCLAVLDKAVKEYHALGEQAGEIHDPLERLAWLIRELARLNSCGTWVNCRLILRLCAERSQLDGMVAQKLNNLLNWQRTMYEVMINECIDIGAISSELSARRLADILVTVISGSLILSTGSERDPDFASLIGEIAKLLALVPA